MFSSFRNPIVGFPINSIVTLKLRSIRNNLVGTRLTKIMFLSGNGGRNIRRFGHVMTFRALVNEIVPSDGAGVFLVSPDRILALRHV